MAQRAVRIRLLGGFGVAVDGRDVPDDAWRLRKARTLVKLLALAPGHRLHRERAIALLWPDRDPAAAANNLHQALHVARRQLGGGDAGRRRLRLDGDLLALCPDEPLTVDVEEFRARAEEALQSGGEADAQAALDLYGGELLPEDLYEEWTEPLRGELERLRRELAGGPGGDEPPAAGPSPRSDNLPSELTSFVGREAELREVAGLLRRAPLVTLIGAAGAGKTRLALEAAARERGRFADGVWLVELAPLADAALIAHAIAGAVGVPLREREPAPDALVAALRRRELLLVLDNFEHLLEGGAALVETLLRACAAVQVLATSREPLRVEGEIAWRVPSLALADPRRRLAAGELAGYESVRLFVERAAAAAPGFRLTEDNAADVARICHRLDGMPLAIELVAARVASLPPATIAARIGASFDLLRQERRTAVTRQQTLAAALDWSYRLLDAREAALLARLAVFAGGFRLDAAEAICATPELPAADVLGVLLRLVDKSLVVAEDTDGDPRYRLLEMVRQYARERLEAESLADALLERHARWYADLAERVEPRRLDAEHGNLRAALAWLLERDPPAALRLAGALRGWWLLRGQLAEGRRWLAAALERAPDDTAELADALLAALPFVVRLGDIPEADRLAERSVAIQRRRGDSAGAAAGLQMLGLMRWLRGDYAGARERLERAAGEARVAASAAARADVEHALGIAAIAPGELGRARSAFERALDLLEGAAEERGRGLLVANPGHYPAPRRDGPPRRVVLEESQILFRRVGPRAARTYVLISLAGAVRVAGDAGEAEALLDEALAHARRGGDEPGVAHALAAIGRLATVQGDAARADDALRESLVLRRRRGDVRGVALALNLLGELELAERRSERARGLFERALRVAEGSGDLPPRIFLLAALAELELEAGDLDAARARLEGSRAVCDRLGSDVHRAWADAGLAEVELRAGRHARAARALERARLVFERCGDRWGRERCAALAAELDALRER